MFCTALVTCAQPLLQAQRAVAPEGEETTAAQRVRDEFMTVLRRYPPSLGQVLKLDPSLMATDQYLATYPEIVTFLGKHPEIRRSPAFYLQHVQTGDGGYYYDPRERAWNNMVEMVGVFLIFISVTGALGWLVKTAIDYRRWGRLAKVQAEAHTKLLDRFTGNDELLAYVQSPAGARFLKSAPITLDGSVQSMGAPLARILWSIQAGMVLSVAGLGLNYVSRRIDPYHADPVFMFSILALSLGIGFIASAFASYILSRRLGLLNDRPRLEDA
jgi:hypothetical protein